MAALAADLFTDSRTPLFMSSRLQKNRFFVLEADLGVSNIGGLIFVIPFAFADHDHQIHLPGMLPCKHLKRSLWVGHMGRLLKQRRLCLLGNVSRHAAVVADLEGSYASAFTQYF